MKIFYLRFFFTQTKMCNEGLPWNVNLLTLDHRPDGKYLLRLEHPYDVGEDLELSKPAVVNLNKVRNFLKDRFD